MIDWDPVLVVSGLLIYIVVCFLVAFWVSRHTEEDWLRIALLMFPILTVLVAAIWGSLLIFDDPGPGTWVFFVGLVFTSIITCGVAIEPIYKGWRENQTRVCEVVLHPDEIADGGLDQILKEQNQNPDRPPAEKVAMVEEMLTSDRHIKIELRAYSGGVYRHHITTDFLAEAHKFELQDACRERDLPFTGNMDQLRERLLDNEGDR